MTTTETLKLALEALEPDWELAEWYVDELREKAITALREALANEALDRMAENARELGLDYEPAQQEPVAFPARKAVEREIERTANPTGMHLNDGKERVALPGGTLRHMLALIDRTPSPPQRTWVNATTWRGLTDEEIDQGLLRSDYAFKTAEAWRAGVVFAMTKLKEKNCG